MWEPSLTSLPSANKRLRLIANHVVLVAYCFALQSHMDHVRPLAQRHSTILSAMSLVANGGGGSDFDANQWLAFLSRQTSCLRFFISCFIPIVGYFAWAFVLDLRLEFRRGMLRGAGRKARYEAWLASSIG